ncbi:MAG TPA: glycosyltransferase family 4 protein [Chryseosolibacter sp.]|nr:glycosyltransferase family 4 protein [Chryseosolibacter sp.]
MKVLILHQHFKTPTTGGAIRSYYLAKALVERGIRVVVVTGHNGPEKKEAVEGIDVHYLSVPYDNRFGFSRRILSFFQFVIKSVRVARHHRDADFCYAISTPLTTGLAAQWIKRRYGIPYIFEVGDLWPDAPVQMGVIKNKIIRRWLYRMEASIYRGASSVVALSVAIEEAIARKVSGKTVHLIPNMSDTDFFRPEPKEPVLEKKYGVQGKFVVSYIGALGIANGLHYFLDCAAASQRAALPIHFILCGDGAMDDALKFYAKELKVANLSFIPFQDRTGVREVMNITDANFICYQPVKILETGSPNKYFDGLAAGKLTIVNFGGWVKDEIERERCGIYVEAMDAEDFVTKIRSFIGDEKLLREFQERGRRLAEGKYSRRILGERFVEIFRARP